MLPSTVSTTSTYSTFAMSTSSACDKRLASTNDMVIRHRDSSRDGMAGSFGGGHDLDPVAVEQISGEVVERRARDQRVGGGSRGEQARFVQLGLTLEHEHVVGFVGAKQRDLG